MKKYYTVEEGSELYNDYVAYTEMSAKVNEAFKEFAQKAGIESKEYYQHAERLHIVPTENDKKKFGQFLKKYSGLFKKNSAYAKQWVKKCADLQLTTPNYIRLTKYFKTSLYGRGSTQSIFKSQGTLFVKLESDCDFEAPEYCHEIKASEFHLAIEREQEEGAS